MILFISYSREKDTEFSFLILHRYQIRLIEFYLKGKRDMTSRF